MVLPYYFRLKLNPSDFKTKGSVAFAVGENKKCTEIPFVNPTNINSNINNITYNRSVLHVDTLTEEYLLEGKQLGLKSKHVYDGTDSAEHNIINNNSDTNENANYYDNNSNNSKGSSKANTNNTIENRIVDNGSSVSNHIGTMMNLPIENSMQQVVGSYSSLSLNMNNLFNRISNTDNYCPSNDSDNNVEKFNITRSTLYFYDSITQTRSDWFFYAANNYKFKEKSFEKLCDHNAQVSLAYNKFNVYKDWMILKTIFKVAFNLIDNLINLENKITRNFQ